MEAFPRVRIVAAKRGNSPGRLTGRSLVNVKYGGCGLGKKTENATQITRFAHFSLAAERGLADFALVMFVNANRCWQPCQRTDSPTRLIRNTGSLFSSSSSMLHLASGFRLREMLP